MAIEPRTVTTVPAGDVPPAEPVRATANTYSPDDRPAPSEFRVVAVSAGGGTPLPSVLIAGLVAGETVSWWLLGHTVGCIPLTEEQVDVFIADELRWAILLPTLPVASDFPTRTPIMDKGRVII